MHLLLDEAEKSWRSKVQRDFPLYQKMPVLRSDGKNSDNRDWTFKTNLKKIDALIYEDEKLQENFASIIPEFWDGEPEDLARDTLEYLLFHELYHPVEAPFSVLGDDNDNKKIHQAIRRGLLNAEPLLGPKDQLERVKASQNGIKDFILDNRLAVDNKECEYIREDIITAGDVLEVYDSPSNADFFRITRVMYSALYGPKSTYSFFEEKATDKGADIAELALSALLKSDVTLPRINNGSGEEDFMTHEDMFEHVTEIRKIFSGEDRYDGIERLMSVLGPYVKKDMSERNDLSENPEGMPQNILQDLFDDMTEEEQADFSEGLLESEPSESMPDIDIYARHEFYKRNHPKVKIQGGNKDAESISIGKKQYWKLAKSEVITEDQLGKLNIGQMARFQRKTRLPMLVSLDNGLYRVNEYELKESTLKGMTYSDALIDTPDVVEFYLDSSGSMYYGNPVGFNDGSRWDMLCNVLYGFADALHQGSKISKKTCYMRIHNFAEEQVDSRLEPVEKFLEGDLDMITKLFKPDNKYGYENLNIMPENDSLKRAYVVATDGELGIEGLTARESTKMRALARHPNNSAILFEIGGTYGLGNAVKNDANVHYSQVHDKNKMLSDGLSVLLSK